MIVKDYPAHLYTFGQIKEYLRSLPPLKFDMVEREQMPDKNFLLNRLLMYNRAMNTVSIDDKGIAKLQCFAGCRRSIGDLYRIAYYYFPDVKIAELYHTMLSLIGNGRALSAICHATRMRVYRATVPMDQAYFNGVSTDEWLTPIDEFTAFKAVPREIGGWGVGDTVDDLNIQKIPNL